MRDQVLCIQLNWILFTMKDDTWFRINSTVYACKIQITNVYVCSPVNHSKCLRDSYLGISIDST